MQGVAGIGRGAERRSRISRPSALSSRAAAVTRLAKLPAGDDAKSFPVLSTAGCTPKV